MIPLTSIISAFNKNQEHCILQCSDSLRLERPRMKHFEQWQSVRHENLSFLQPWEPKWTNNELTRNTFSYRVNHAKNTATNKTAFTYLLILNGNVIGGIALFNIRYGSTSTGTIGYWLAKEFNGQGHMNIALNKICDFGFNTLGLARLESACIPTNERSIKLLKRCDFQQEGIAKSYLEINGKRQDHILFAKVKSTTNS